MFFYVRTSENLEQVGIDLYAIYVFLFNNLKPDTFLTKKWPYINQGLKNRKVKKNGLTKNILPKEMFVIIIIIITTVSSFLIKFQINMKILD